MICKNCGKNFDDKELFCPYCGKSVTVEAEVISEKIEKMNSIKKSQDKRDNFLIIYSIICLLLSWLPFIGILLGSTGILCSIGRLKNHGNKVIAIVSLTISIICLCSSIIFDVII